MHKPTHIPFHSVPSEVFVHSVVETSLPLTQARYSEVTTNLGSLEFLRVQLGRFYLLHPK